MNKISIKNGNMLYPLPVVLVSCADNNGNDNIITVAWTGTICSDPAMVYISVRKERYSYNMLCEKKEFVINLPSKNIVNAVDYCGVKSGRDVDKWKEMNLTKINGEFVSVPMIKECPINLECKIENIIELGSHDMFIAKIVGTHIDKNLFDNTNKIDLNKANLISYNHGEYFSLGEKLGSFGFSVNNKNQNLKCKLNKNCGSCKYINLPYIESVNIKQKYLQNLFSEFTKVEKIIHMNNPYHYRNKVHHVLDVSNNKIISGSYVEGTHKVININNCLIEDETSQKIINTIKQLCKTFKYKIYDEDTQKGFIRHILIRKAIKTNEIMVVLVCANDIMVGKNNFVKALIDEYKEIKTIILNVNNKKTSVVLGDYEKNLYGKGYIVDELLGYKFRISAKSFYQINPIMTEILYKKAIELAELKNGDTVIDAYCGIGTIGICATKFANINLIGIELNKNAIQDAKYNAKINNINKVEFIVEDASKWISNYNKNVDVIFMDPPREGSTEKFIKAVCNLSPKKIIYISCGPESLKRDLKLFINFGYKISIIQPIDMFPFTEHIENVVLIEK